MVVFTSPEGRLVKNQEKACYAIDIIDYMVTLHCDAELTQAVSAPTGTEVTGSMA